MIPLNYYSFSPLFNALISLILVPIVLFARVRAKSAQYFLFFLMAVTEWSVFYFLWLIAPDPKVAEFYARTCMIGVVFMPPIFFQFIVELIERPVNKTWNYFNYFLGILFVITIYSPLYIKGMKSNLGVNAWPVPGPIFPLTVIHFILIYAVAHYLMWKYISANVGLKKEQVLLVFAGTFIGGIAGASNFISWYTIYPPVLNIFTSIYVTTIAYAITKMRLMDISLIITRGLSYLVMTIFYLVGYFCFNWAGGRLGHSVGFRIIMDSAYILFTGLTFQAFRLKLQTTAEKTFLKGNIDVQKTLARINEDLLPVVSLEDFFKVLDKIRLDEIEADAIRVWLPETFANAEGQPGFWTEWQVKEGRPDPQSRLSEETIWVKKLLAQKVLHKEEAKEELKKLGLEVCLACFNPKGPVAIVGFGRKLSEDAYTSEELNLFTLMIPSLTLVLERIKPFEELQEKVQVAKVLLEKSQNLAQLGTLSAGIAHEIRNPLGVILLKAEKIKGLLQNGEFGEAQKSEVRDSVGKIIDYVERTTRISENMLRLARNQEDRPAEAAQVDLAKFLDEILEMGDWKDFDIVRDYAAGIALKADLDGLRQVFVNLLQNARTALKDNDASQGRPKRISIKAWAARSEVEVEIADNGAGIAPQNLDKIFDPFFTTRHEGVGVGLSICYRIIREHGGTITVESAPGQGTKFKITLPKESA